MTRAAETQFGDKNKLDNSCKIIQYKGLQDYFKSFLYPLIATIAMILISEVTKWYLKGIIGDFIGILVCVLVYLAVVYVVARKQLLNIIQTIKKEKV